MEEVEGLFGSETFCVFGEGLCGDADALHFVAAGFEERAGVFQHLHRVGDLLLLLRAVEFVEGGFRAVLWFGGFGGGWGALGGGGGCGEEERDQDYEDAWAVWGHFFG